MCYDCAYFFDENPRWGGHINRCLINNKQLTPYALCMGCNKFKKKCRKLVKLNK